jgi:hypothetical protein
MGFLGFLVLFFTLAREDAILGFFFALNFPFLLPLQKLLNPFFKH